MWVWSSQPLPFSAGTHLKEHLGLWHPIVSVGPSQDVRGVQREGWFLPAVGVGHDYRHNNVQLYLTCHSCHKGGLHVTACHTRGAYMSRLSHKGAYMSEEAVHYLVHRLVAALQSWEENPEQQRGNTIAPPSPPAPPSLTHPPHTPITYSSAPYPHHLLLHPIPPSLTPHGSAGFPRYCQR